MSTIKPMKTALLIIVALLLALTLAAGSAFAQGNPTHGGGTSSSGGVVAGGGNTSPSAKEAKSAFNKAKRTIAEADNVKGQSVELSIPGSAVTTSPGQAPTKYTKLPLADITKLSKTRVNKNAPVPSRLK